MIVEYTGKTKIIGYTLGISTEDFIKKYSSKYKIYLVELEKFFYMWDLLFNRKTTVKNPYFPLNVFDKIEEILEMDYYDFILLPFCKPIFDKYVDKQEELPSIDIIVPEYPDRNIDDMKKDEDDDGLPIDRIDDAVYKYLLKNIKIQEDYMYLYVDVKKDLVNARYHSLRSKDDTLGDYLVHIGYIQEINKNRI